MIIKNYPETNIPTKRTEKIEIQNIARWIRFGPNWHKKLAAYNGR